MKYLVDEKTGLKYRDDTIDLWVIREQSGYTDLFKMCRGKTVLDIGANIGAFADRVMKVGAKRVFCFEPESSNFKLLSSQEIPKAKLFNMAVSDTNGTTTFYVNKGRNKGLHSLNEVRGRDKQEVKLISFEKVIDKVRPDIIKVDIEGGEYNLDFKLLNAECKAIAIEIHFEYNQEEKGDKLLRQLRKMFDEISYKEVLHYGKRGTGLFIGLRK